MDIKNSETGKNLQKAFEIVSKRRMEYDIYALIAKLQGFEDVSRLLSRFAEHEREHAKLWYRWSNDGKFPKLLDCMKLALEQEEDEINGVYEKFASKAREEGVEQGIEQGAKNEKNSIAKNLLNIGIPVKDIVKATGLSKNQISMLM